MENAQFPYKCPYWINQQYSENQASYATIHGGIDIVPYKTQGVSFPADVYPVFSGRTMSVQNTDKDRGKGIKVRTIIWPDLANHIKKAGYEPGKYLEFLYWHFLEVTDLDNDINQSDPIGKTGNTGNVWSSQFPEANGVLQPVPDKYKGVEPYYGLHLHLECRTTNDETILNLDKDLYGRIDPMKILNYKRKEQLMEILKIEGEETLVVKNLDGKFYQIATAPELYPFVAKTLGLENKPLGSISRAEVSQNLGGDLTAGLTFINK